MRGVAPPRLSQVFAVIISNVTIATVKDSRFCLIPFCNAQSRQSDEEGGVLPEGEVVPVRILSPQWVWWLAQSHTAAS